MKKLSEKTEKDLQKELTQKREALREFRFGVSGSKIKNTKEGKNIKKEIARVLTELNTRKNNK